MRQYIPKTLLLLVLQIMICGIVYGQQPVGNLSGVVTDQAGSVLPNATITITSLTTGLSRTITSNGQGYFLAASLQAGQYKVKVTSEGFSSYEVDRLVVEVGQTPNLDVKMKVGGANESVQISGSDTSLVDTVSTSVGGVVSVRQVEQLPLNGRNYLELAKLQPGVEIQEGGSFDPTKTRYSGVSIGSRGGREARITIDGIDAVDEHVGTTTLNISQDSIQEFQVSTSSSDPSAGLSATGAINIVTKRGGNEIHGGAFGFARNNRISARPTFAPTSSYFRREQFGGNVGGPILTDKLFGFANYERTQEKSVNGINSPYFPNITAFKTPYTLNSFTGRGDYHISDKHDFLFRMGIDDNSNFGGFGGSALPSSGNFNKNRTYQYIAGLDTVVSPKITNSFRAGLTSFKNRVTRPDADAQAIALSGFQNYRIATADNRLISGPDANTPQSTGEVFGQFRDDITYFTSSHTIRAGADIVRYRARVFNFAAGFPSISVNSPATFNPALIGDQTVRQFTIGNLKGIRIPGADDNSHRNTRSSVYAEDSWRIRPNLTVSYGARYEIDSHPINNDLNKPAVLSTILPNGTASTPIDRNNVSPHVGIAYDPWKDGKTSFRAGAGIYYAQRISNLVTLERASLVGYNLGQTQITLQAGQNTQVDFNGDGVADFDFAGAFGVPLSQAVSVISAGQALFVASAPSSRTSFDILKLGTVISNDLETPYSQQFNVGVQRELPLNSVIDINLIYSRTVHEFQRDNDGANFFPFNGAPITLGDGTVPTTAIGVIRSDGFSRYKALNIKYDKRFGTRFQATGSYAFSKLETTSSDGLGLGGTERLVNRLNSGNLGVGPFDRRHRFVFNGIVELPRGFRFSGISTVYSGVPANATVAADLNGDGILTDLLPGTRRGSLNRSITSVQDLNAKIRAYNLATGGTTSIRGQVMPFLFEVPDSFTFGDSFVSQDFQLSYTRSIREGFKVEATAQVFNAFNVSNLVGTRGFPSSGINGAIPVATIGGTTGRIRAADGSIQNLAGQRQTSGSNGLQRPTVATGTGLPRAAQFGLRLVF